MVSGGAYVLQDKQEYEDELPNPFGGDPFPTRAYFLLEDVSSAGDTATIVWNQQFDQTKAREVLLTTFREMAERMGTKPPKADELPEFSIVDEARFLYDRNYGVPRTVSWTRTVCSGDQRRIDSMQVKTSWPEAR
jgi:hypothetical protein